ncbi:hypothetical protein DFH07DRAFT_967675 [Mycena maculata]|uniref:DUF6534 domain-containing protein n=1 Tax=Mycena maculata TaxID=230809 RepID=A0AAD7I4L1_9AGAR|nr:hypothetical protein DFH07DRAFT_967675 [Mycena maculata]
MPPAATSAEIVQVSGPLIIGYLLHWGLFGFLSLQTYVYYDAFPNDRLFNKALVYTVYLLELVMTILITHDAFMIFGSGFSNLSSLTEVHFDWLAVPIMGGLVALIGQTFYSYRVYVVSKSLLIPCVIVIISLTSSVGALITGVWSLEAGNITRLVNHRISIVVGVWCGASALSDIIIAVCMTYYLTKRDTGFRQTHAAVSKLIRLIIETGSLTAVVALINLALFVAFPNRVYYTTPGGILPKLYANAIMVIFNARIRTVGGRGADMSNGDTMSYRNTAPNTDGGGPSIIAIRREVFSDMDSHVEMKVMGDAHVSP